MRQPTIISDLIGTKKAAEILKICSDMLRRLRRQGKVSAVEVDERFLFDRQEIQKLAADRTANPPKCGRKPGQKASR